MHNVNIQLFTSAGTPKVQPNWFFFYKNVYKKMFLMTIHSVQFINSCHYSCLIIFSMRRHNLSNNNVKICKKKIKITGIFKLFHNKN